MDAQLPATQAASQVQNICSLLLLSQKHHKAGLERTTNAIKQAAHH